MIFSFSQTARTSVSIICRTGTSAARCHTGDLGYSWGTPTPNGNASEQQHAYVELKNTSGHTCALRGFPGVDLVNGGQRWPLRRDAQTPATVTLRPGAATRFTITFLPWTAEGNVAGNDFAPTTVVITPPDETTQQTASWTYGSVCQHGELHTVPLVKGSDPPAIG